MDMDMDRTGTGQGHGHEHERGHEFGWDMDMDEKSLISDNGLPRYYRPFRIGIKLKVNLVFNLLSE
jgi:hypothetical protein